MATGNNIDTQGRLPTPAARFWRALGRPMAAVAGKAWDAACDRFDRVPADVRAMVGGVFAFALSVFVAAAAVTNVVTHQGFEVVALAKPAAETQPFHETEVMAFGAKVSRAFGIDHTVANEFADWILEASARQSIAPELLASLVITESSFRKTAVSNVGAIGPAQVRPDYWGNFCGTNDLDDPAENVYCGAQVLSYLMDRCEGEVNCALAAYNIGPYGEREAAAARYVAKIDRYLASFEEPTQPL